MAKLGQKPKSTPKTSLHSIKNTQYLVGRKRCNILWSATWNIHNKGHDVSCIYEVYTNNSINWMLKFSTKGLFSKIYFQHDNAKPDVANIFKANNSQVWFGYPTSHAVFAGPCPFWLPESLKTRASQNGIFRIFSFVNYPDVGQKS